MTTQVAAFFLFLALTCFTCAAREYNCTVDDTGNQCDGNGKQAIYISGKRMCCPPTASFTLNGDICKCVEPDVKEDRACLEGVVKCRQASTVSTDSRGRVRCCMAGHAMNSVTNSYVNGVLLDLCTCTPFGAGGSGFFSTLLGNGGMFMSASGPGTVFSSIGQTGTGNTRLNPQTSNAMREAWRQMGDHWDNFGRQMQNFGRNLGQRMLGLGRALVGDFPSFLSRNVRPLRRNLDRSLLNLFRPQPTTSTGERTSAPAVPPTPSGRLINP